MSKYLCHELFQTTRTTKNNIKQFVNKKIKKEGRKTKRNEMGEITFFLFSKKLSFFEKNEEKYCNLKYFTYFCKLNPSKIVSFGMKR